METCIERLTVQCVDEVLCCGYSKETCSAVLLHGIIFNILQKKNWEFFF